MVDAKQLVEPEVPAPTAAASVPERPMPRGTAGELIPAVSNLRYRSDLIHTDVTELGQEVYLLNLAERTAQQERRGVRTLLEAITAAGLSWTLMSRILGVSVPAIRKWRLGEGASPESRHAVAELAALLEMLDEQFVIEDPAAWLEIPLAGTARTLADVLAAGHQDLVLEYACRWISSPQQLLDRFDPSWRETESRREFETFVASDGAVAIRRRGGK